MPLRSENSHDSYGHSLQCDMNALLSISAENNKTSQLLYCRYLQRLQENSQLGCEGDQDKAELVEMRKVNKRDGLGFCWINKVLKK